VDSVPEDRRGEYDQLMKLLMDHAAVDDAETRRRAEWIARSALEPGHLYRAMGFADRSQVRTLLRESFPELEAANDRDMRWKKFFYRRMCGWAGFTA
jgi:nitrogen fixation protein NifQ